MKHLSKVTLFFLLAICCQENFAQVKFDESSLESVLQRAKREHKPVFLMLYASWCPHCNKMKSEVFPDATLADYLNANFICTSQDVEKDEGQRLQRKFQSNAYPTFVFLDENGAELYSVSGELKAADVMTEAKTALTPEKQLPFLKQQFYNDTSNSEKCLAYLMTLRKGRDRKYLSAPAHTYLATQTDAQLASATNWRIIANAVTDIKSREFQYVLQHQDDFAKVASPIRVERKIVNISTELLNQYVNTKDSVNYFRAHDVVKSIRLQKTDSLVFKYDLDFAEKSGNWKFYEKTALESTEKIAWNDAKTLKEIGMNFGLHITTSYSLKKAVTWVERSLELSDSYDRTILLSRLYIKINDKKSAIAYAKKAMELSKSLGFNTKEADALYLELDIK